MPKVTFLPMNKVCEAATGESLLEIAVAQDIAIQHACGGYCACTTCLIHVKVGGESLSQIDDEEDERLGGVDRFTPSSRLACQAKLGAGDVTVEIQNLDY